MSDVVPLSPRAKKLEDKMTKRFLEQLTAGVDNSVNYDQISGASGVIVRTDPDSFITRNIVPIVNQTSVTNGSGVVGDIAVGISPTYPGQTSITTLGTVTTGDVSQADFNINVAGSVARDIRDGFKDIINVKDFGATGDGSTDDTAAIQAAVDTVSSATLQCTGIFFPNGAYALLSGIDITGKNVHFFGTSPGGSCLFALFNGVILNFNGAGGPNPSICGVSDLRIDNLGTSETAQTLIKIAGYQNAFLHNLYLTSLSTLLNISDCFLEASQIRGESAGAGSAVMLSNLGGNISNALIRKSRAAGHVGPCLSLFGQITSLNVSNSNFGGVGTPKSVAISQIIATGSDFTITSTTPHGFNSEGELIVIRNVNSSYNGVWRIASITSATILVVTLSNAFSNFTSPTGVEALEHLASCCYFDNSNSGIINETNWTNCLFEGIESTRDYGSCSLYFNGANGVGSFGAHTFGDCLMDAGQTAVNLCGKDAGAGVPTILSVYFSNCLLRGTRNAIQLRNCNSVHFSNCEAQRTADTTLPSSDATTSSAVYIDSLNSLSMRGLEFSSCNLGRYAAFDNVSTTDTYNFQYGINIADGSKLQGFIVKGNFIHGQVAPSLLGVAFSDSTSFGLSISDNVLTSASTTEQVIGSSTFTIASASSIALPWGDVFRITGTTTVNTITGGWNGRSIKILAVSSFTLAAVANSRTLAAGEIIDLLYYNGAWYSELPQNLYTNGFPEFFNITLSELAVNAALATDGSKNLVSVLNTGTGNNVLQTSPTLITPALGTPSSGVLTNCTGLPIVGGTTGTLTEARGGTGVTACPKFKVYRSSNQSISSATLTKVTFNATSFDTNSNWDGTNFRFTPTIAGYYQLNACVLFSFSVGDVAVPYYIDIAKNGGAVAHFALENTVANADSSLVVSDVVFLNGSTDYVEVNVVQSSGGARNVIGAIHTTYFSGGLLP